METYSFRTDVIARRDLVDGLFKIMSYYTIKTGITMYASKTHP